MRSVQSLPQAGEWEIQGLPSPLPTEDGMRNMGIVYDRDANAPRALGPVDTPADVRALLVQAALEPMSDVPQQRPRVVRCRPRWAEFVRDAVSALWAELVIDDSVNAVERMMDALSGVVSIELGDVPQMAELWRPLLARLPIDAVGESLDTTILLTATGAPGRPEWVCIVDGEDGTPLVLTVYRSAQDALDDTDAERVHDARVPTLRLLFHRTDTMTDERRDALKQHRLTVGAYGLMLYAVDGAVPRDVTSSEETLLLALLSAVVDGYANHRGIVTGTPGSWSSTTLLGALTVSVSRVRLAMPLAGVPHLADFWGGDASGRLPNKLVLQMRKSDARSALRWLKPVRWLSLARRGDDVEIEGWSEHGSVGQLARVAADDDVLFAWMATGRGDIVLAGGGTSGRLFSERDVVATLPVSLLREDGPQEAGESDSDDVARRFLIPPSKARPGSKASEALLAFVEPVGIERMGRQGAEQALQFASVVFAAVAQADHHNDPSMLQAVRDSVGLEPEVAAMVELLVKRKRAFFAEDKRVMSFEGLKMGADGELKVRVMWADDLSR